MIEEKELHYFPVKILEYTDPGWTPEWCEEFKAWAREFPANQSNFPEGVRLEVGTPGVGSELKRNF